MALPSRGSWGKIIGGILGLTFGGGLWGGALGFILGHLYDRQRENEDREWSHLWGRYGDFSANREQAVFTMGVIVLGAKMAKSDGRVTRAEIEAFKRVFHIAPAQEEAVGRLFDDARCSAEGFEPYAFQLAHVFHRRPAVLEEILSGLFIIGAADTNGLSGIEVAFLKRVSFIFGFSNDDFLRIAAQSGLYPRDQDGTGPIPAQPQTPSAYAVLGVPPSATNDQIKAAYRALIREHHPDRLMAQGMPPEFVASATEKMKRINVAYDDLCKLRGIK